MMSEANLQLNDASQASVSGVLTFASAPDLLSRGAQVLQQAPGEITIDLSGVTHCDSAGVALLLEWRKQALGRDIGLRYSNIPEELLAIARISDAETLLAN